MFLLKDNKNIFIKFFCQLKLYIDYILDIVKHPTLFIQSERRLLQRI